MTWVNAWLAVLDLIVKLQTSFISATVPIGEYFDIANEKNFCNNKGGMVFHFWKLCIFKWNPGSVNDIYLLMTMCNLPFIPENNSINYFWSSREGVVSFNKARNAADSVRPI